MSSDDDWLERSRALLRLDDHLHGIRQIDPKPSAEELGAVGGYAYEWPDSGVVANVYKFAGYSAASQAANQVRAADGSPESAAVVNGSLFMYATSRPADDASRALLLELNDSFAGEE
jgi:hypothetical protein